MLAYVEMLQRLQLFALAARVLKWSDDEAISAVSQRSTTLHLGGPPPPRSSCSVCELPVRGSYVWCQASAAPKVPAQPHVTHDRHRAAR